MKNKHIPSNTTSMTIRILVALAAVMLTTTSALRADNSFNTAIALGPSPNSQSFTGTDNALTTLNYSISPAGDRDYYRIVLAVGGTMVIDSISTIDTYGYLYGGNQNWLAQDDDSGESLNFRISRPLAAGTYYVRVNHYSSSGTGNYQLRFAFTADQSVSDDHGNSIGDATALSLSNNAASSSGRIEASNDNDYFRIVLNAPGALVVNSTGSTDVYGHLLNSTGGQITADDDSGEGYNFRVSQSVAAGTYYIRVRHYSSSGTGAYGLQVAFTPTAPPPLSESTDVGGAFPAAVSINPLPYAGDHFLSAPFFRSIGRSPAARRAFRRAAAALPGLEQTSSRSAVYSDNDFYRFTVETAGRLNARTTGNTDTFGHLYNGQGQQIAYNDDAAGSLNFNIGYDLTPGTYYLRVRHYSQYGSGPYRLLVDFTAVGATPAPGLPPVVAPVIPPIGVLPTPINSTRRAVVVGISNYQYINDLALCDDDARAIKRLLQNNGWSVTLLLDNQATKAAIRSAITTAVNGASDFIFHFSGHGTRYGSTGYVCTYDGQSSGSFYSEDEMTADIATGGPNLRAGVILDSCHSGEFISRNLEENDPGDDTRAAPRYTRVRYAHPSDSRDAPETINGAAGVNLSRDLQRNGWTILTGCRGSQYSYELGSLTGQDTGMTDHVPPTVNQANGHGWLTFQAVTRLPARATDANRNNRGSIEEVHRLIAGGYNGIQHPQLYDGDATREFEPVNTNP